MDIKEILEIILGYLKAIVVWPTAFFVVALIFIFKFKQSLGLFLENIASIKVGPFEASQRQTKGPDEKIEEQITENLQEQGITLNKQQIKEIDEAFSSLAQEKETKEKEGESKDQIIKYLVERSDLYEFAYLSLYLVHNSKIALLWFYNQPSNSSTKENFTSQLTLPPEIVNPLAEKEAIFNALLVNGLLEQSGGFYKVSEKGIKFLKHTKFIQ